MTPNWRLRLVRGLWFLLLAAACTDAGKVSHAGPDAGASKRVPVVDNTMWQSYPAADDPLAGHQPAQIDCGLAAFHVENGSIEFDTGRCNYQLAMHPALQSVAVGTPLSMMIGHFDLTSPTPATAHAALLFGDRIEWETTVDIPHSAQIFQLSWNAKHALAKGQPVRMHLHNHGQNVWALVSLEAELPATP